jgi:hypothetical protein
MKPVEMVLGSMGQGNEGEWWRGKSKIHVSPYINKIMYSLQLLYANKINF